MNPGKRQGPSLCRHKRSGNGYAKFNGRQIWFGPFDDPATHRRFAVFKAEWEANGRRVPKEGPEEGLSVADLVAAYLEHAEVYYRKPDGSQTHEVVNVRYTARPLLELFGELPAADFDLRRLKLLREHMISSGLSRVTVNQRVARTIRMIGWATDEQLVPPTVYGGLRSLRPLRRGRSRATETHPVRAVSWEHVEATLDYLPSPVRAMVLLQWHSGMRPGEVVQLRPADLDRSGVVWVYRPRRHKLEHHGRERLIGLGPKSQAALRPFLVRVPRPDPERPLFSPKDAVGELHASRRRNRRTPLWPSHERRNASKRRRHPSRRPGEAYDVPSYRRAIRRGCAAADVPTWTPNRLRHAAATRIRRELGLEAARTVLGHSSAATSEVYAEADRLRAIEVMAELG